MHAFRRVCTLSVTIALAVGGSLEAADDLKIHTLSPPSGSTIPGPSQGPDGRPTVPLDDSNSILITYQYSVQSSPEARILQYAWRAQGIVAHNNYWTFEPVNKGNGFARTRLTVLCKDAAQADTTVTFINYKLIKAAGGQIAPAPNELLDRAEPVSFRFTCGPGLRAQASQPLKIGPLTLLDDLKIVGLSPPSGRSIPGPPEGTQGGALNDSNSILITYQYKLQSGPEAQIRQWAWSAPDVVAHNNFWTWAPVSQGNGQRTTRLTVLCKSASQADTAVRFINYRLIKSAGGQIAPEPNDLLNKSEPVSYTFTCGPTLQKASPALPHPRP